MKPRTKFLIDVAVEGRMGTDGSIRATTLLATCACRFENAPEKYGETPEYEAGAKGA